MSFSLSGIFKKRETQIRGIPLTPLSALGASESGQYCSGRALSWAAWPGNLAKMRELLDFGDAVPSIGPSVPYARSIHRLCIGPIMRPVLVKNRDTSLPWTARRAMASAETRFRGLRVFFIKLPPGSHADTGPQEAVEQYREHEQCEGHVQPIAFDGESYDGEGYACYGGGNEE